MAFERLKVFSKIISILGGGVALSGCMGGGSSTANLTSDNSASQSQVTYKQPSDAFAAFTGSFTSSGLASNLKATVTPGNNAPDVVHSVDVTLPTALTTFTTTTDAAKQTVSTTSSVTGAMPDASGKIENNGADLYKGGAEGSNKNDYLSLTNALTNSLGTTTLSYAYVGEGAIAKATSSDGKTNLEAFMFNLFGGQKTSVSDMPTTGSASYSGAFKGRGVEVNLDVGSQSSSDLDGKFAMSADFNAKTVSGTIDQVRHVLGGSEPAKPVDLSVSFNGAISGNQFSATPVLTFPSGSSATQSGVLQGGFFGPKAAETAGALAMKQVDGSTTRLLTGSFGAKKQ